MHAFKLMHVCWIQQQQRCNTLLSEYFPSCLPPLVSHTLQTSIKIWDLESKSIVDDLRPEFQRSYGKKAILPYCVSLAWSADGSTLYAGYTDGMIRVFVVSHGM